jgi:hypothetical protein
MADDPKKKKQGAKKGGASSESSALGVSGPNPVAQVTDDEYNEALLSKLQSEEGAEQETESPVVGFWQRLQQTMAKPRELPSVKEMGRSVARGVMDAGAEVLASAGGLSTGLAGGDSQKAGDTVRGKGKAATDALLGQRSDDPLASFTEGVTQFVAGFAALRRLPAGGLVKGAIVDGTMFDPYEAQLAELAARSPVPGLREIGKVLSVDDDAPAVARLKRAVAGAVPGVMLDGLVAGARLVKAGRAGNVAEVAKQSKVLEDIENGTHSPNGKHVTVKQVGENYTLLPPALDRPFGDPLPEPSLTAAAIRTQVDGAAAMNRPVPQPAVPRDPVKASIANAEAARDPLIAPEVREHAASRANELLPDAPPVFATKAEALQQAESINAAIDARASAGRIDDATIDDAVTAMARGEEPVLAASHHNTVEQDLDLVKTLSERIIGKQRGHVATEGQLSVENAKALAKETLAMIPADKAHATIKGLLNASPESQSVVSVMADMVMGDKGRTVMRLSDVVDARPHDPVAMEELTRAIEGYFDLRHSLYGGEADAARRLRFIQERDTMRAEEFSHATDSTPASNGTSPEAAGPSKTPKDGAGGPEVAGMETRDASQLAIDKKNAAAIGRMFKMANGNPRDTDAILHAAVVMQKGGTANAALEVFTNSLLSGPQTWATVSLSGSVLSLFEPVVRAAAGIGTGNRALFNEGVDTLAGLFLHLGDNIKIAAAAMREGRSIVNPAPTTYAIGGLTGKVIRTPGNIMLGLDEFTRVSNYRAYIRAKSLRAGREAGLEGNALAARVDQDLRMAFDPETGIATVPAALKYADVPTLSAPLGKGFGAELQKFTNNALAAKFIVPFVRASTNIFRYTWQSLPGLNALNAEAREVMKRGGEEAAVLHARSALASTVYGFGFYQAMQGNLTGKGPSDPDLRKLWLKNHQPYSLKVGDKWVSYARMDPLATPLGLMADLNVFAHELGTDHPDFEDGMYAVMAALVSNMGSKTYLRGVTEFAEAWGKGDPQKVGRWLQNFAGAMAVPNFANKMNPDPYFREVQGMVDKVKSRLPYFSETLDPAHNIFGEKVLKTPGIMNRSVNPMTTRDVTDSRVEEELLTLGRGLSPAPDRMEGGMIDLHDKSYAEKQGQPSPYVRWMELVRTQNGGLRAAMEKLVASDSWKMSSDGTDDFPGGRKLLLAQGMKERYESQAFRQVLSEYPKLHQQLTMIRRSRGAAIKGDDAGVRQVESLFGIR